MREEKSTLTWILISKVIKIISKLEREMKVGNYDKARAAFKLVFDNFPKSEYRILAKLDYAESFYKEGVKEIGFWQFRNIKISSLYFHSVRKRHTHSIKSALVIIR